MGCDIHLHTEVKIEGVWHHYGAPSVDRNYDAFAKMTPCGRREGQVEPLTPNRGLPEDATALTRYDYERWGRDAHSASYMTAEEILAFKEYSDAQPWGRDKTYTWMDWEATNIGYFFGNTWAGFSKYPDGRPRGVEDIRWVFWFDN